MPASMSHRLVGPGSRLSAALAVAACAMPGMAPSAALAQPVPCAASSDTPRTAAEVIAAVAEHRCPAGSRLRVAMTIAGQAIVLQRSGLCEPDSFRTMTRRPTPETSVLGVTCTIAAR